MIRTSPVFSRLKHGENIYGLLNSVPSPLLCEMIAFAGYHFVILDMEHLLRSEEDLMHCLRACEAAGISAWLRIPDIDTKLIGRALDAGVEAIVLPRVESADDVARALDAAYFPPRGKRGISGGRITGFGRMPLPDYVDLANQQSPIVPMIESVAGLRALPEILALPGVGMVLEGALDLALDMQVGPEPLHPDVWLALQAMADACAVAEVPFCANPRTPEQHAFWCNRGIRSFLAGEDRGLLHNALKARLSSLQSSN
ncbi:MULTISPECIES: aldolase/citrate lyase family protein [unclassified Pseudomonas]|uniref:HpcH/HpaI aldolase family protein n=2 Tax=Pseudomonas TaxID=286 RepID=UPI002AC927AE|nr:MULTISPECIES: aldolase/citrate lyase family protein [unclassified Pseudomonas]MEB0040004.1 aldolase/citrate lyase family protein [Pseudomonas sp. MH10]MEB0076402.1 aldolase/citrate lyase family protein [Pseudomonas sp. MH10out]MEB0091249.1 aldolase/citrate lyase family protein [Pseudomonas sp. CCI4.2]MEB0100797.1 aldolase/citrate lyase family protein [Pseudomonas sp. CCI3.2]MEB0119529.1 aldolase/citrate lyase family protein [Pseudomonas sp. CCI1.2]